MLVCDQDWTLVEDTARRSINLPGRDSRLHNKTPTASKTRFFYITRIEHPYEIIAGENLRDYFGSIGVATREIVMNLDGSDRRELARCLNGDAIAVLGFNWHLDHSSGAKRIFNGKKSFLHGARKAGVPVIQWIMDHPSSRWLEFARTNATNSRFLFQSKYAEAYFRRFVMPHCHSASVVGNIGASRHSRCNDIGPDSFLRRDIPCLLPLNLRRLGRTIEDSERILAALPPQLRNAVVAAVERAQNDLVSPIEVHFFDNDPPRNLLRSPNLFHQSIRLIEEIVQLRRRIAVFAVAREFPVLIQSDIAGASHMRDTTIAKFEQDVGMIETLARMKRARAVVSLSAVTDEIHDRTVNALNAGAVPIIEDSAVNRRFFTHGKNALLFRYDDDSLRQCFDLVCSYPDRAYDIAQAGIALRDDPRLRVGFQELMRLAQARRPSFRERVAGWFNR